MKFVSARRRRGVGVIAAEFQPRVVGIGRNAAEAIDYQRELVGDDAHEAHRVGRGDVANRVLRIRLHDVRPGQQSDGGGPIGPSVGGGCRIPTRAVELIRNIGNQHGRDVVAGGAGESEDGVAPALAVGRGGNGERRHEGLPGVGDVGKPVDGVVRVTSQTPALDGIASASRIGGPAVGDLVGDFFDEDERHEAGVGVGRALHGVRLFQLQSLGNVVQASEVGAEDWNVGGDVIVGAERPELNKIGLGIETHDEQAAGGGEAGVRGEREINRAAQAPAVGRVGGIVERERAVRHAGQLDEFVERVVVGHAAGDDGRRGVMDFAEDERADDGVGVGKPAACAELGERRRRVVSESAGGHRHEVGVAGAFHITTK